MQASKAIYSQARLAAFVSDYEMTCVSLSLFPPSISAGLPQDVTIPAKHCPVYIMRPSYHETIATTETSLIVCFSRRLKHDKLLTHRASNDESKWNSLFFT